MTELNHDIYKQLESSDKELVDGFIIYMRNYQQDWANKCVNKFMQGCIDHHGEDLKSLDFDKEIEEEFMDIEGYKYLKKKFSG